MMLCTFDIGGTKIKYGVITDQGEIITKSQMDTNAIEGGLAVVNKIIEKGIELKKQYNLVGIGISSAGQIDSKVGKVIFATENIPNYTGIDIKEILEKEVGLPVAVENDVNCTALGEYWKGVARGEDNFIVLTLGTGIGGSIVIDGKIHTGASFSAGEFGHITLYPKGVNCLCGSNGCYEMYASSKALKNKVRNSFGESVDSLDVFHLAKAGHITANQVIDSWVYNLALGMRSIIHIFNPGLVVIGGGISEQGDFLLKKIDTELRKNIMPSFGDNLRIKMALMGNDANLLGAAYHFINSSKENM